ncbi:Lrp/AsnC family transcriptional regulator [Vagococcus sp. DIV0080]|uniref:Lrp/AsnC family transcriptional regulator n=1 Tax=Candidatus Vagococcus giribetii TaxID=2230876 RepID=A0ABS3HVN9_9ENTE|nr:Lrp/AsnC family transcriptional regulator [Vagococcus sp. DIV0080]MBO0477799.1 Lrp/AsnC family transcriptional regulator [Vagococcus sp. DIV0080]
MPESIDRTSLEILNLLSTNSRMSVKEISQAVLLSEPSVKKRIDKMTDLGIIKSFTTRVFLPKIGYDIIFFTNVSNLSITNSAFLQKVSQTKEFIECYSVTGRENYLIKGVAQNIQEVESILNELTQIANVETSIVLEEINLVNQLYKQ